MKQVIWILMLFLPLTTSAQEKDSESSRAATPVVSTEVQQEASPATTQKKTEKAKPSKPQTEPKAEIPGSMVGYIDDPIVSSKVRIRFDDDFDDQFPDRSEFIYAKCSCYRGLQNIIPPAYDPNAPGPGPGVPKSVNFQQLYTNVEYAPLRRLSAFVEVPIRWLQPEGFQTIPPFSPFSNQAGLSDVMAGIKFAAIASEGTYVTFQFKSYFPSGDSSKGLGTNHYSVEPSLLVYHRISSRFTLEGQVGDWHPIGGSAGVPISGSEGFAGDVFFYGIGPSYRLYQGNHFSVAPVVEVFGWHVLGGFQTQPVTGTSFGAASEVSGVNIVNIKVGLRIGVGYRNSFYVGFGQAVTHDDWYKHLFRAEYRYSF
ncbi:MAG: hypothetical protein WA192_11330 [Candidatus Acidiferrales bacterium]